MSLRGVPDDVLDDWFEPATASKEIRRDLAAFATSSPSRTVLLEWADRLATFERPALVVWATRDTMMPREHGSRLAALLPQGRLVEIDDAATLIPEDQPERLVVALKRFLTETGAPPASV
jgi:pimeloyl-ACP methyl ester carboxylesterase